MHRCAAAIIVAWLGASTTTDGNGAGATLHQVDADAVVRAIAAMEPADQQKALAQLERRLDLANRLLLPPDQAAQRRASVAAALRQPNVTWDLIRELVIETDRRERAAITRLVRQFRVKVYETFYGDRKEYDARLDSLNRVMESWGKHGGFDRQHVMIEWLMAAVNSSLPTTKGPLPPEPRFDLPGNLADVLAADPKKGIGNAVSPRPEPVVSGPPTPAGNGASRPSSERPAAQSPASESPSPPASDDEKPKPPQRNEPQYLPPRSSAPTIDTTPLPPPTDPDQPIDDQSQSGESKPAETAGRSKLPASDERDKAPSPPPEAVRGPREPSGTRNLTPGPAADIDQNSRRISNQPTPSGGERGAAPSSTIREKVIEPTPSLPPKRESAPTDGGGKAGANESDRPPPQKPVAEPPDEDPFAEDGLATIIAEISRLRPAQSAATVNEGFSPSRIVAPRRESPLLPITKPELNHQLHWADGALVATPPILMARRSEALSAEIAAQTRQTIDGLGNRLRSPAVLDSELISVVAEEEPIPISVNLDILAARIDGNTLNLRRLEADLDDDSREWSFESLTQAIRGLRLLVEEQRHLQQFLELASPRDRQRLSQCESPVPAAALLARRISEAQRFAASDRFRGTPAERQAELDRLDRLARELEELHVRR